MNDKYRYLFLYLAIAFGIWWGIAILFILFGKLLAPVTGELTLMHPITIFALYLPSIAGLIVYFKMGDFNAIKGIIAKLIPRKQDLIWFPILLLIAVLFALSMHYGSLFLSIKVPQITYTVPQMFLETIFNLIKEAGLLGGIFGWMGFLLPYLQAKLKNNVYAGLLTGFLFGLWVLPGYIISSFGTTTSYLLYVIQLMLFILFQSYIFNATRGSLIFYLFSFWLIATGSHIQLYYFNSQVQILQIIFFAIITIITHFIFKKAKIDCPLQTFPDFIQINNNEQKK